jgi:hypothetical protein
MARLFADRIRDKREMLRQAPVNAIVRIPVAEVDAHVELPVVPRESMTELRVEAMTPVTSPPAAVHRRGGLVVAAAAAGAVAVGCALWFAVRAPGSIARLASESIASELSANAAEAAPVAAVAATPAPEPAPAAPLPIEQPAKVRLAVESIPPGAEVSIDGKVATTPCSIDLVRTDEALTLAMSRRGFQLVVERVVPDTDQKVIVHLQPVGAMASPKKGRSARPKPVPPTKKPPVFERFD